MSNELACREVQISYKAVAVGLTTAVHTDLLCARVRARVRECARGCVVCSVLVQGNMGFPGAASTSGSLLLVDVWACPDRVRRVCRTLD
jgi:hypothetical protein